MKKISKFICIASFLPLFISCSKDEDAKIEPVIPGSPTASQGIYALTEGNFYNGIEGGLNVLNFETGKVDKNVFKTANGRSIGDTPQCGVAYGSKIYVGTSESNTIEVFDRFTWKSIKQIKVADFTNGGYPYSMVADKGKIFISMFGGNLARLDTLSLSFDKIVPVGNNPDKIALYNNKIFVPISDGMNYPDYGTTAVVVDPVSMLIEKTFTTDVNPVEFFSVKNRLFLLCMGNYSMDPATLIPSTLYEVKSDYSLERICNATIVSGFGDNIAIINQPFSMTGSEPVCEYKLYSLNNGTLSDWNIDRPDYANSMYYDEAAGSMLIASYVMGGAYPSYVLPGYVNQYDSKGEHVVHKYELGAAGRVCFFTHQK